MKLLSAPLSMFGAKAEIALREKGLAFELEMAPFSLKGGYTPKHPEVARINPKAQVPVLIDRAVELYDSTQIFEYLEDRYPEPNLWPRGAANRARARQLELASDEVFFPHVVRLMGGRHLLDTPETAAARQGVAAYYVQMEQRLAAGEHLCGAYGFADIAFYMAQLFAAMLGAPMTDATPRLLAWRDRITQRPAVSPVAGRMGAYLARTPLGCPDFLRPIVPVSEER